MARLTTLIVAALLASEAVDALKVARPKTNKDTKAGVERKLRTIVGSSVQDRPAQAVKIDANGKVTPLSPKDLATSSGKNRELKEYLDAKKADIAKTQKAANKASSTSTSDSKKQWKMKRFQRAYPAQEACLDDARNTAFTKQDMADRNAILTNIQPWKFENTTLEAYQETPTIEHIYYINGGDKRRKQFMEKQLKNSKTTVAYNRWPATLADDVDKMPVNGGVPQHCWDYSSGGMADYLQKMDIDSVLGTTGVYLSHADLMLHIGKHYNTSDNMVVIMEDDAQLSKGWEKNLLQSVKSLPEDWDIARFVFWGGKRCQDAVPHKTNLTEWYEARGPDTVGETNMYAGNQAYIVRPKSIPYILATLRDMPVMDIDGALGSTHKSESKKLEDGSTVQLNWGIHTYVRHLPLGDHKYFEATLTETGGSKRLATKLPGSIETHAWGDGSKTKGLDRLKDPLEIAEDLGFKTPEYNNWGR